MNTSDKLLETASRILARCSIMGFILLLWWWVCLEVASDFIYAVHSRIAPSMSELQFQLINYIGMISTKLVIMILFLLPWIAMKLISRTHRSQSGTVTTATGS